MNPPAHHPEQAAIALLAGGELAWQESFSTRLHLLLCSRCKRQFELFRSDRIELGDITAAELRQPTVGPRGADDAAWNVLEAELRANIRLGLTVGSLAPGLAPSDAAVEEDADDLPSPAPYPPWRWAVVCGALVFVLTAGWWLRTPGGSSLPVASVPAWELPTQGPAAGDLGMQVLLPVANVSRTETDFDGSTRSRVIDGETGQVTLQQVYVE